MYKNDLKWTKDLHGRAKKMNPIKMIKNTELIGENIGVKLYDIGFCDGVFDMALKNADKKKKT